TDSSDSPTSRPACRLRSSREPRSRSPRSRSQCSPAATSCGTETALNMVTPQSIEASIRNGLACDEVDVGGDGHHFEARIVSPAFRGLSRVARHRLVYAAMGD